MQQQQWPPGFEEYWHRVLNSCPPDRHEDAREFVNQLVAHVINKGQLKTYNWYTAPVPELAPVFEQDELESISTEVLVNMTEDSFENQENVKPDTMFAQQYNISMQTDQHMFDSTIATTSSQITAATSPLSNHHSSSNAKRRRQRKRSRSFKYDNSSNDDYNFIWNPSLTIMPTEWMKE